MPILSIVGIHARILAPARELSVAGGASPEADWLRPRLARNISPRLRILAEGFLFFGADHARRYVQSDCRAAAPRKIWIAARRRLRNDFDGPMRLGMRAGYGHRSLNENLAPLRRYLHAQIGRPWNKVYSEICAGIDRRNTVQQHIHQHIRDFIAIDVGVRDGRLVDLAADWKFLWNDSGISQELYVDPRTGLIRPNKGYRSWRHSVAQRRRREQLEIATRRRIVDQHTMLLLLNDLWFRVEAEVLPKERPVAGDVDRGGARRPNRGTTWYCGETSRGRTKRIGTHANICTEPRSVRRQQAADLDPRDQGVPAALGRSESAAYAKPHARVAEDAVMRVNFDFAKSQQAHGRPSQMRI